jgi:hypothetical protein
MDQFTGPIAPANSCTALARRLAAGPCLVADGLEVGGVEEVFDGFQQGGQGSAVCNAMCKGVD